MAVGFSSETHDITQASPRPTLEKRAKCKQCPGLCPMQAAVRSQQRRRAFRPYVWATSAALLQGFFQGEWEQGRGEMTQPRREGWCWSSVHQACGWRAGLGAAGKREDPASGPDSPTHNEFPDDQVGGEDSGRVILGKSLNLLESLCPYPQKGKKNTCLAGAWGATNYPQPHLILGGKP